ncbi:MAG: hypothetical protein Q9227_009149 [Pyrenula ochraceoflavens]
MFRRNKDNGSEDSQRHALFGKRDKKPPAPSDNNPYAQNYAPDPYTAAKVNAGVAPPPQRPSGLPSGPKGGLPSGPRGGQKPSSRVGYNQQPPAQEPSNRGYGGGYGAERFGNQGGYGGGDRYGTGSYGQQPQNPPGERPGGYGGLGNEAEDSSRDALFGGAKDRYQAGQPAAGRQGGYDPSLQEGGGYGETQSSRSYGAYGDRQLTAEEEEEEDIQATKAEIRDMKRSDVSSTRNALRIAQMAEETGRNTLARLGQQGESIHNTERNLDLATNSNRVAEEKARELKKLNGSMFAVHVSNPFTSKSRAQERDNQILNRHREEREQREATREAAFQSTQRMQSNFKDLNMNPAGTPKAGKNLAERSKYMFENDSEEDEMENEIDTNLDLLHGAATNLNTLARATGQEVESQNRHLERIAGKSDFVDDQIHMNRQRLDRIK